MRKIFSLILTILFITSALVVQAQDKKEESNIKIQKYELKASVPQLRTDSKDAYLSEGFEGTFPPTNWVLSPGTGRVWKQGTGSAHGPGSVVEGTKAIYFDDYNYPTGTVASITSPAINLTSATTPILEFYYWDGSEADFVKVNISTNGVDFSNIYNTPATVSTWTKQMVDLTAYAGQTVYIQFVGTSVWGYSNPHIDQFVVDEPASDPVQTINYTGVNFGMNETNYFDTTGDVFIISNTGGGTLEISSVSGFYGTPFSTNFDETIQLTAGQTDTFAVDFMSSVEGDFSAQLVIESNGGTDTITATGSAYDPTLHYLEGFETAVPPTDWQANILSGTYNWAQYTWSASVEESNVAKYNSYNASVGSKAELISSRLDLSQVADNFVSFYYAHPTTYTSYTDFLEVYFSENDGTDWVKVDSILYQDYYWHFMKYDVSDYVSNTSSDQFRVKFVATSDYGASQYIDKVILPLQYVGTASVDWCNLQWPASVNGEPGYEYSVYGQVYESGITDQAGQGAGIEVWFGLNDSNTNPANWDESVWRTATYNNDFGNNDEYMVTNVITETLGSYYYSFRYRLDGGSYSYGGYSSTGGGPWDSTNYVNGEMVVEQLVSQVPYFEGFETAYFPPLGWANEGGLWMTTTESHSGSYAAKVRYNHSGVGILQTNPIVIPDSNANYMLSFWWKDDDMSAPDIAGHDTTFCEISTNGTDWSTLTYLSEASYSTAYVNYTMDITTYVGQNIQLRWRDVTDAAYAAYGTGVDDVEIYAYQYGPGVATNPIPENGAVGVPVNSDVSWTNPELTFYNKLYGSMNYEDVANMVDSVLVLDGSVDTTIYSSIVAEGMPFDATFYWRVVEYDAIGNESVGDVWSFTTEANTHPAPFDLYAFDNIGFVPLYWSFVPPSEAGSFSEGFESSLIDPNWSNIDQDGDTFTWGTWNAFVNSGNYAATSFSYSNSSGALTPNNWLITPSVELGETPSLTFYAGASDANWYQEHFQVKVSTVGQDPSTFTTDLLDVTLGSDAAGMFKQFTVDLSAYANQTIYLAWVHNNVTDQYNLSLDDIKVTGIADGKNLSFNFEEKSEISQFKIVSTPKDAQIPLKKTVSESASSYKERVDKFTATHINRVELPKALQHFNVYRNGEVVGTSDTLMYVDYDFPAYNQYYSYYVTAVYDDAVESNPSNEVTAYVIDPASVIFYDDFEEGTLPGYYTVVDANNDGKTWVAYGGLPQSGAYSMAVTYNSTQAMDDWAYIGPISLHAAENYNLSFGYRAQSGTYPENMAVYLTDTIDSSKSIIATLFDSTGIANTVYSNFSTSFGVPVEGQYYIAFYGYSDADMWRLAVDDVLLIGNGELVEPVDSSIVFFDDFEDGTANWQLYGAWGLVTNENYSPVHSLTESPEGLYPDDALYYALMVSGLDFSEALDAELSFYAKYEIEEGFDYMYVDIKYDGISGWRTLTAIDGVSNGWEQIVLPLGGYVGQTGVKIRFRFDSDGGFTMDGMYIDDVQIRISKNDLSAPLVVYDGPQDEQGTIGKFVIAANITDISGVAYAGVGYVVDPIDSNITPTIVTPDSVYGSIYYFSIPEQEAGAKVYFGIAVADSVGNIDTVVSASGNSFSYISGNYLMYDNDEVTFVLEIPVGAAVAKRISLPENTSTTLVNTLLRNYTDMSRPNGEIDIHVWADNSGLPGNDLITPIRTYPSASQSNPYRMTETDLRPYSENLNGMTGDFWVGFSVPAENTTTVWMTLGRDGSDLGGDTRSFVFNGSAWSMYDREFHFRAITGAFDEVGINENQIPVKFELMQNYPNPFNPATTIKFALPISSNVEMKIYNAIGQEVTTLVNKQLEAGYHSVVFDASKLASGLYIYRIQAGNFVSVKKMMLLK